MCAERPMGIKPRLSCLGVRAKFKTLTKYLYLRKDYTYFYSSLENMNKFPFKIARCQSTHRNHFQGLRHKTDTQTFGTTAVIFNLELHGYIYKKIPCSIFFLRAETIPNAFLQSANNNFPHLIPSISQQRFPPPHHFNSNAALNMAQSSHCFLPLSLPNSVATSKSTITTSPSPSPSPLQTRRFPPFKWLCVAPHLWSDSTAALALPIKICRRVAVSSSTTRVSWMDEMVVPGLIFSRSRTLPGRKSITAVPYA